MGLRSDWAIRFEVCDRLVRSEDLDASGVYVSVREGLVRLFGHVASRRDHDAAVQIAAAVSGVRGVDDRLAEDAGEGPGRSEPDEEGADEPPGTDLDALLEDPSDLRRD